MFKRLTLVGLALALLFVGACRPQANTASQISGIARPHEFSLFGWEVRSLTQELAQLFTPHKAAGKDDAKTVVDYFSLIARRNGTETAIEAIQSGVAQGDLTALQQQLADLNKQANALEVQAEDVLEAQVRQAMADQGINHPFGAVLKGSFGFPPVQVSLEEPPKLLVISPRDKIERTEVPEALRYTLEPLFKQIGFLTEQIKEYDKEVKRMCKDAYKETELLRQVDGVGEIVSLGYILTLDNPGRFAKSRDVGAYLGLIPRQYDSGDSKPQMRITKTGDRMMRALLVQSAQRILGRFGKDSDLRRHGLKIAARGGKNAKKRAITAVARKLAVLLHRLWVTGEVYEPLRNSTPKEKVA